MHIVVEPPAQLSFPTAPVVAAARLTACGTVTIHGLAAVQHAAVDPGKFLAVAVQSGPKKLQHLWIGFLDWFI